MYVRLLIVWDGARVGAERMKAAKHRPGGPLSEAMIFWLGSPRNPRNLI